MISEAGILNLLDDASPVQVVRSMQRGRRPVASKWLFPMLGEGEGYSYVAAKLTAYSDAERWVAVVELSIFSDAAAHEAGDGHQGALVMAHYFGNCVAGWDFVDTLRVMNDGPGGPTYEEPPCESVVREAVRSVTIRDRVVCVDLSPAALHTKGIDPSQREGPSADWDVAMLKERTDELGRLARHDPALVRRVVTETFSEEDYLEYCRHEDGPPLTAEEACWQARVLTAHHERHAGKLHGQHLLRSLIPEYSDLLFSSETELRRRIPLDLPQILRLHEWRHPEVELPSETQTFQMIAKVLATADPSHYRPTETPNTDWRDWVDQWPAHRPTG